MNNGNHHKCIQQIDGSISLHKQWFVLFYEKESYHRKLLGTLKSAIDILVYRNSMLVSERNLILLFYQIANAKIYI